MLHFPLVHTNAMRQSTFKVSLPVESHEYRRKHIDRPSARQKSLRGRPCHVWRWSDVQVLKYRRRQRQTCGDHVRSSAALCPASKHRKTPPRVERQTFPSAVRRSLVSRGEWTADDTGEGPAMHVRVDMHGDEAIRSMSIMPAYLPKSTFGPRA